MKSDAPTHRLSRDEVAALKFAAHRQLARWAKKRPLRPRRSERRGALVRAVRTKQSSGGQNALMKTALKVMLGIVLGCTVLVVGCAALIGAGVNAAQKDSDKTAITSAQYRSAPVGSATRSEIEGDFGEPQSSNDIQAEGIDGIPDTDFSQQCVYYSRKGELASLFQFCFDGDGTLRSKASF